MNSPQGLTIFGVTGRMGQALVRALHEPAAAGLRLVGAVASPGSSRLGQDASPGAALGITVTADARAAVRGATIALDFSLPQCVAANAEACAAAGVALLVGTTGFDAAVRASLESAAAVIPVLIAPNTSVGVAVLTRLVGEVTRALGPDYDVEIAESHHRMKRDAPSGTALALGEAVAAARGRRLTEVAVFDRHGAHAPRGAEEIGFAVTRGGDTVGEHTVTFAAAGECVQIMHRATDRATFARGALRAAAWLAGRPAGRYTMSDVLGWDKT